MINVLHVPGNIEVIKHATSEDVRQAETSLKPPISMESLLEHADMSAIDIVHLHTIEFATLEQVRRIDLLREMGKRVVFTLHELRPNIESDHEEFFRKTRLATALADSVITLSRAAANEATAAFDIPQEKMLVVPHGQPFVKSVVGSVAEDDTVRGIAAYGAMRTYRSYTGLLKAWQTMDASTRPPLRMLLRSVSAFDLEYYHDDIRTLQSGAEEEDDFTLQIHNKFLEPDELVAWLKQSRILALPYTDITHSGQLELGLDLGMGVIAPEISSLRSQAAPHPRGKAMLRFAAKAAIKDPEDYARSLSWEPPLPVNDNESVEQYRQAELERIKAGHRKAYGLE
jgi:hypothetical protein